MEDSRFPMETNFWANSRCPGCNEELASLQPKLLSCFHSICSKCVINNGNQIGGNGIQCIVCKQESHLTNILDNEFIKELQGKSEGDIDNVLCTCCDDQASATSYCCDCTEYLCETCVLAHGRTRMTKQHKIKPKEEVSVSLKSSIRTCSEHKFERLMWYCVECRKVTCRDCQLVTHRNHEYVSLDEVTESELEKIKKVMKDLEASLPSLRNKKASILKLVSASEKELEEIEVAINEQAQNIKKLLDEWASSLLSMIHDKLDPYKHSMTSSVTEIDRLMKNISNAGQFIGDIVTKSNYVSILQSKDFIIKQLEELINKGKLDPVFTTNSYQFFRAKMSKVANSIKRSGYITEKEQNVDTLKFLIAPISAADKVNEDKLVQCRTCQTLTDFGPSCQYCGMPIPHNLNPEKRQIDFDNASVKYTHDDDDPSKGSQINLEIKGNISDLEISKSILSDQEICSSPLDPKKQLPVAEIEMQESTEKSSSGKKSKSLSFRSSQRKKKSVDADGSEKDNDDGDDDEDDDDFDSLYISSESEDDFTPKKQPKRGCKRSSSRTTKSTPARKRGPGRPSKRNTSGSNSAVKLSSEDLATPGTSGSQTSPHVDLNNLSELRQMMLRCRSVRIGSLKTIPQNPIDISVDGIDMVVANPQEVNGRAFNLLIPTKLIVGVACHFGRSLPVMYIYTNKRFKEEVIKKFGDEVFDPDSEDEAKKRIIILPEKFSDEDRMIIKNIFKDICVSHKCPNLFGELDVKAANAILVMSTPADQK